MRLTTIGILLVLASPALRSDSLQRVIAVDPGLKELLESGRTCRGGGVRRLGHQC